MTTAAPRPVINVDTAAFRATAHATYARLRTEAPVVRATVQGRPAWIVTRYDDVAQLLKDDRLAKERRNAAPDGRSDMPAWAPGFARALRSSMLDLDAPDHTRLRGLVHQGFTPKYIEQLRGRIETLADERVHAARKAGRMDLIADYALPIPLTVICELLGVPERDRTAFHHHTKAFLAASSRGRSPLMLPAILSFVTHLRRVVQAKRRHPGNDLLSALTTVEAHGDRLSENELLAMAFLLVVAGHETTVNLIGNGMLALFDHPGQRERLQADPTLMKSATEEFLRFDSPVELATERYAREDLHVAGTTIPRGELVHLSLASANRDETQFTHPDTLDLTRTPNRHVAFGQGIHYCLGAPLARLEGTVAISTLLREAPGVKLAAPREHLKWRAVGILRGLEALPVTL